MAIEEPVCAPAFEASMPDVVIKGIRQDRQIGVELKIQVTVKQP
ncbi:hypothetical protein ACOCG7_23690 [Paraburkholderia sp. DD10]|jgi:hypothetical protein|nr:hypothetical protein [Paraburkholderia terricola]